MLTETSASFLQPRCRLRKGEKGKEEDGGAEGCSKERWMQGGRMLRSRRYRRPFEDHRHTKRLFTPEIKRFLKGWLVRRRDNPYPNRDEKKALAVQTGLTYIQICNWFANWRRKLKNAGNEARQRTWGTLIKSYNTQAQGNVEQFSICSDDSIWEEQEQYETESQVTGQGSSSPLALSYAANAMAMDHSYSALFRQESTAVAEGVTTSPPDDLPQCCLISSTTAEEEDENPRAAVPTTSSKYKSHMMEKYLRDLGEDGSARRCKRQKKDACPPPPPLLLSKWLESAARFQPSQNYVTWSAKNVTWRSSTSRDKKKSARWNVSVDVQQPSMESAGFWSTSGHHREELDAAVALTCLSGLQH